MSSSTMPQHTPANGVAGIPTRTEAIELRTDEGLRDAMRSVQRSGSSESPAGQQLLAEICRRAVRNAAHVAAATSAAMGRGHAMTPYASVVPINVPKEVRATSPITDAPCECGDHALACGRV